MRSYTNMQLECFPYKFVSGDKVEKKMTKPKRILKKNVK